MPKMPRITRGHKSVKDTEIYINIEQTLFESTNDEFTVKVANKPEEVKELLEVGFEWGGVKKIAQYS